MKTLGSVAFRQWLKDNGKYAEMQKQIGSPRITLSKWANGHIMPSSAARFAINAVTGGAIKPQDWFVAC